MVHGLNMELKATSKNAAIPEGYVLISIVELHRIEDLVRTIRDFRGTYFSYNKKLNRLFNIADEIIKSAPGRNATDENKRVTSQPS